jgi:hypothetical protein
VDVIDEFVKEGNLDTSNVESNDDNPFVVVVGSNSSIVVICGPYPLHFHVFLRFHCNDSNSRLRFGLSDFVDDDVDGLVIADDIDVDDDDVVDGVAMME